MKTWLSALGALLLAAIPAHALNTRTWISGHGVDQSGCGPINSPCRTLQYAHAVTTDGGEIDVLDGAGYGSLVIGKSINIINEGVGVAGVLAPAGGKAIDIQASYGTVVLRGLTIEGAGLGAIGVASGGSVNLTIQNCLVQNFAGSSLDAGNGILLRPSLNGSKTIISNTTVQNNGYIGVWFYPTSTGHNPHIALDRVTASNNSYGVQIQADQLDSPDIAVAVVNDSQALLNSAIGFQFYGRASGTGDNTLVAYVRNSVTMNPVGIGASGRVGVSVSRSLAPYTAGFEPIVIANGAAICSTGDNAFGIAEFSCKDSLR